MEQAVLEAALPLPDFNRRRREYLSAKWIPQGWQWVDPKKEFDAMLTAIRAGLLSRSEAISAFGYDAEDIDREIAADNLRADELGLVFDSDPRHDKVPLSTPMNAAATVAVPQDHQDN
jgi:capsid protein